MLFPAIESLFDCFCFSYIVFAAASEIKDFMSFTCYFYIICDLHERIVKMEREALFSHITCHLCKQQDQIGLQERKN